MVCTFSIPTFWLLRMGDKGTDRQPEKVYVKRHRE